MNPFYYRAIRYSWNEDRYRTAAVDRAKTVPEIGADGESVSPHGLPTVTAHQSKSGDADAGERTAIKTSASSYQPFSQLPAGDPSLRPFHISKNWDSHEAIRGLGPPKFLVALDPWALEMELLTGVAALAKVYRAQLLLIHVIQGPEGQKDDARIRMQLRKFSNPHEYQSYQDGAPGEVLLREAERQQASLLILATHGRVGKDRVLEGSVAEEVLKQASIPVLIHRPGTNWSRLEKILVPFDDLAGAWPAIKPATELGESFGADLWLLHVRDPAEKICDGGGMGTWLSGMPKAHAELRDVESQVDVPASIAAFAEQEKIDLLVMPSEREDLSKKILPGGVTAQVARAVSCSVLVVPK